MMILIAAVSVVLALGITRGIFLFLIVGVCVLAVVCRRKRRSGTAVAPSVGFVHPDSAGGGGGERVLWIVIQSLQLDDQARGVSRRYVLYTKHPHQPEDLFAKVKEQFGVQLPNNLTVEIAYLRWSCKWLEPERYPRLTLLLQSVVGAFALGYEVCVTLGATDVIVDTVGIAFTYPWYRLFAGARIICYVHYPTISTDMIQRVSKGSQMYNNSEAVSKSEWKTQMKLAYYRWFAFLYYFVGHFFPAAVMTNSTWTNNHIKYMWKVAPTIVYPPVNVAAFEALSLQQTRSNGIVSVGQFRPEKNHMLQVKAFHKALPCLPQGTKLFLVGGVRNSQDAQRVEALRRKVDELGISQQVEFCVSCSFDKLMELLGECAVGLHTMLDEHFGIVAVEYAAAGCVPLAHNSGGVKADIVVQPATLDGLSPPGRWGILATTEEEFANGMIQLLDLKSKNPERFFEMQSLGRAHSQKFSDAHFGRCFLSVVKTVCN